MKYIANSFSLSMLPRGGDIEIRCLNASEAAAMAEHVDMSIVGHVDTAAIFSDALQREFPVNRQSITLKEGDELLVGQYTGPRLPEGATSLPEGAEITWRQVIIKRRQMIIKISGI